MKKAIFRMIWAFCKSKDKRKNNSFQIVCIFMKIWKMKTKTSKISHLLPKSGGTHSNSYHFPSSYIQKNYSHTSLSRNNNLNHKKQRRRHLQKRRKKNRKKRIINYPQNCQLWMAMENHWKVKKNKLLRRRQRAHLLLLPHKQTKIGTSTTIGKMVKKTISVLVLSPSQLRQENHILKHLMHHLLSSQPQPALFQHQIPHLHSLLSNHR